MSETQANGRGPARHANGRFGPGNSGRPPGSGNRMSREIAETVLTHFRENQGEFLDKLSKWYFADYVRLVSRLLPRPPVDRLEPAPEASLAGDPAALAAELGDAMEKAAAAPRSTDLTVNQTAPASPDLSQTRDRGLLW